MKVKKLAASICQDASLLNESKRYTVYAILFGEETKFLVEDEEAFSFPFFVSAKELEIIDNTVSKYWKVTVAQTPSTAK